MRSSSENVLFKKKQERLSAPGLDLTNVSPKKLFRTGSNCQNQK